MIFSKQKFIGNGYVFNCDEEKEELKEAALTYKIENTSLPLSFSLAELKQYVGTDLSQKEFILSFYTNGSDVLISKEDKAGTKELEIFFNHAMSRQYLGL